MSLLHLVTHPLANSSKRAAIYQSLARLDDRALADLGLERHDIAAVARMGAELGPEGATLADVVARVRAPRAERPSTTDRYANFWKVEPLAYTPADLDRYMAEAQRLRGETLAAGWRWLGRKIVDLARPAKQALLDSPLGRRARVELVWRRAYRQTRTELESYSDREFEADLRRSRSDIGEIAAEAADELVAAYIAAEPSLRGTVPASPSRRHAHG